MSQDSIKRAIANYYKRQEPKPPKQRRKNQTPEKEVETECVKWFHSRGFRHKIIEAKAVWSKRLNRYTNSHVKAGTLDCQLTDDHGFAGWVEFKALGKRNTIYRNPRQLATLKDEIRANVFACVVDSAELLTEIYDTWIELKLDGQKENAIDYLFSMIPDRPKQRDASLF